MMNIKESRRKNVRVLAIDPGGPRFGFAVLEGPDRLVDWGLRKVKGGKTAHGTRPMSGLSALDLAEAPVDQPVRSFKHGEAKARTAGVDGQHPHVLSSRLLNIHHVPRDRSP